jgi:hypothetical protein
MTAYEKVPLLMTISSFPPMDELAPYVPTTDEASVEVKVPNVAPADENSR